MRKGGILPSLNSPDNSQTVEQLDHFLNELILIPISLTCWKKIASGNQFFYEVDLIPQPGFQVNPQGTRFKPF
jgi:hypothetical protein